MPVQDPQARVERLIAVHAPELAAAFLATVSVVRSNLSISVLEDLLERGAIEQAVAEVQRAAGRMGLAWTDSFVGSATDTGRFLERSLPEVVIDFDQTNFRAVDQMQRNRLRLIREFTESQRNAIRESMLDGITRGLNPREQARAIRNSIGLTQRQQRAVQNYREALENLDRRALRRELRDRRFDRTVDRAIRDRQPLAREKVERMVTRYRERFLNHRATVIGRTEALRSVHAGVDEMYSQAIDSGELVSDQLIRIWNPAGDERVRDFENGAATSHRTMRGQERPPGIPFTSGAGNSLRFPGDPDAPSIDTIQCRCVVSTRILLPNELPGGIAGAAILQEA